MMPNTPAEFRPPRALCIGDVMLDIFTNGEVTRISPEAPVPVLRLRESHRIAGGAANVARNFAALEGEAHLMGFVGDDVAATHLCESLDSSKGLTHRLIKCTNTPTIIKERYSASGQQILRVDTEPDPIRLDPKREAELTKSLTDTIEDYDIILVSDYAKGLVTATLMATLNHLAQQHNIPVLVDPKQPDWHIYGACTLIKPNAKELSQFSGLRTDSNAEIEAALSAAKGRCATSSIVVTRAEKGMSALQGSNVTHISGQAKEVYDVSGAGDTVLAALGYALAQDNTLQSAMELAITASGIVVGKRGTAVVTRADLTETPQKGFFHEAKTLKPLLQTWRAQNLKIGFTNGCFDILHPGHLRILEASKAKCDRLIVGLNADASVTRLKGPQRPINNHADRAAMLLGLTPVDAVILFQEDTPKILIEMISPDLLTKGGDYTEDTIIGAEHVRQQGGEVMIIPLISGQSTTQIIKKSNMRE